MCSYCGCDSIDVIGRFMSEHVEIINATGDLRRAVEADEPPLVHQRVAEVAGLLGPHTGAEEVGLFSVMKRQDEFTDYIGQLCGEHVTLDDLLERVAEATDPAVRQHLFEAFEQAFRTHIDREDNALFPAAAVSLVGPDWDEVDSLTHDHDHTTGRPHAHQH
ncbi:hemerythrin domain-containing protein [Aestuariimicrobium kwangyangense]|uniref:hemerythrin domain-containing protein n=1 Tax=Aestuariimicrobium kwangyangense TaxID=396389 RepID=UPI0003B7189F|nr:hemerythrin domain-containing protein [Aestuariimicrobium kwangyangense]